MAPQDDVPSDDVASVTIDVDAVERHDVCERATETDIDIDVDGDSRCPRLRGKPFGTASCFSTCGLNVPGAV